MHRSNDYSQKRSFFWVVTWKLLFWTNCWGGIKIWRGSLLGGFFLLGGEKWANFQVVWWLLPYSPYRENSALGNSPTLSTIWNTLHTEANRLTQQHLLCAHCSCLYYIIEWIICWYQKFTLQSSTMYLLFKNYSLAEVTYLLIKFNKTKFFPWVKKYTDEMVK